LNFIINTKLSKPYTTLYVRHTAEFLPLSEKLTSCILILAFNLLQFHFILTFIFGGLRKYNNLGKQKLISILGLANAPMVSGLFAFREGIDFNGKKSRMGNGKGSAGNMNIDDE